MVATLVCGAMWAAAVVARDGRGMAGGSRPGAAIYCPYPGASPGAPDRNWPAGKKGVAARDDAIYKPAIQRGRRLAADRRWGA